MAELEKRLDELSSQFAEGGVVAALNPAPGSSASASASSAATTRQPSVTERPGQQQQQQRKTKKCDGLVTFEYLFPSPRSESAEASGWSSEVGCNDCAPGSGSGGAPSSSSLSVDQLWPTASEAEALLLQYHETHAPLTPFVVIPRHLTAAELRRQRPFLWRVVMMVSCFFDGPRQHRLGKEVLAEFATMAVLDGTKSLETLQGLLLMIGW